MAISVSEDEENDRSSPGRVNSRVVVLNTGTNGASTTTQQQYEEEEYERIDTSPRSVFIYRDSSKVFDHGETHATTNSTRKLLRYADADEEVSSLNDFSVPLDYEGPPLSPPKPHHYESGTSQMEREISMLKLTVSGLRHSINDLTAEVRSLRQQLIAPPVHRY
jgi:hypothetical protein